jgi:hypothetical protein
MVFRVKVEEYAQLLLKGSDKLANHSTAPVYAWAASSQDEYAAYPLNCGDREDRKSRKHAVSCPQIYWRSGHVAALLNLVINLRDGKISSFAWDNGCDSCGPLRCMTGSRYLNLTTGAEQGGEFPLGTCGMEMDSSACSTSETGCALKVFITWAGTDRNGQHAVSAGMRMSKFTGYSLGSIYEKAKFMSSDLLSR